MHCVSFESQHYTSSQLVKEGNAVLYLYYSLWPDLFWYCIYEGSKILKHSQLEILTLQLKFLIRSCAIIFCATGYKFFVGIVSKFLEVSYIQNYTSWNWWEPTCILQTIPLHASEAGSPCRKGAPSHSNDNLRVGNKWHMEVQMVE